jgi:hypothetical protein
VSKPLDAALAGVEGEPEEEANEEDTVQVPSGAAATKDAILPNVLKNLV